MNHLPHEMFCHLNRAAAAAAYARAVVDLAMGEVSPEPDAERAERLASLLGAVDICLSAAAAALGVEPRVIGRWRLCTRHQAPGISSYYFNSC